MVQLCLIAYPVSRKNRLMSTQQQWLIGSQLGDVVFTQKEVLCK